MKNQNRLLLESGVSKELLCLSQYFIAKGRQESKEVTNKKLQKLVYYAQAWALVFHDKTIYKDNIKAWVHGPAIPALYHRYKKFGYERISEEVDMDAVLVVLEPFIKTIDMVWEAYSKYDARYLELLTHNEEPWINAREGLEEYMSSDNVIPTISMKSFYKGIYDRQLKEIGK